MSACRCSSTLSIPKIAELEGKLGERVLHKRRKMSSDAVSPPTETPTQSQDSDSDSELSQLVEAMWLGGEHRTSANDNLREFGMASNKGLFALAAGFTDRRQSLIKGNGIVNAISNQPYNESDFGCERVVYALIELYFSHVRMR